MPDSLNVTVPNIDQFISSLEKLPEKMQLQISAAFDEFAKGTARDAKSLAPGANDVKNSTAGFLRNSIGSVSTTNENQYLIEVYVNAFYAPYLEFGTGTHVEIPDDPDGVADFAIQFKGTHSVPGIHARPFLFPAFRKNRAIFIERLNKILAQLQ